MESTIAAYRSLWNNRLLNGNDEEILREAISRELKDEFTHPRVRRNPYEKFYSASKRILASSLPAQEKETLLIFHVEEFEKLNENPTS